MNENNKFTEYLIPREDIVYAVEFCNVDISSQLLAVGTELRVSLYTLKFKVRNYWLFKTDQTAVPQTIQFWKEEDEDVEDFEFEQIYNFQNGCRVTAIAWSPETNLVSLPKLVRLAAAGADRRIRVFSTDLKNNDSVEILEGHTDFINSMTFDPGLGDQLASTGDDKWCRIWGRDGDLQFNFPLSAHGMSVCWHRDEPLKVMVAQKNGVIKIFSLTGQQVLMSFDCGQVPLMEADWSIGNKGLMMGAVAGSDLLLFDVSVSSRPVDKRQIHIDGARYFRWAKCHDSLVASVGRPGCQVKILNTRHQQTPITISQQIAYGMSWHNKLPALAIGGDQNVHIYMMDFL